jgi:hypothetical protein
LPSVLEHLGQWHARLACLQQQQQQQQQQQHLPSLLQLLCLVLYGAQDRQPQLPLAWAYAAAAH